MGHRDDDRNPRRGTRDDENRPSGDRQGGPGRETGPMRAEPGRVFERDEDMGGAGWSGSSGRGGMSSQGRDEPPYGGGQREYVDRARASEHGGGHGYDPRYASRHSDNEGIFVREQGFGHVPGQRWSGGYGGDRPSGNMSGRGFTGNDFGPPAYDPRDRRPGDRHDTGGTGSRHFGTDVDRGGRMGPGGAETTTGRGYWGWESDRASGANVGTDMGMGSPDAPDGPDARDRERDRGPHYGKGPKGYKRSDERIRDDVCEAIAHQGHIDASDVEVKVENGVVTLSGSVAQRHQKRTLEQLVERCRSVDEVHNELRLKRGEARPKEQGAQDETELPSHAAPHDGGLKNGKSARS